MNKNAKPKADRFYIPGTKILEGRFSPNPPGTKLMRKFARHGKGLGAEMYKKDLMKRGHEEENI